MSQLTERQIQDALDRIPYAQVLGVRPMLMGDELTMVLPFIQSNIGNPVLPALHGGVLGAFMEITAIVELTLLGQHTKLPKPVGVNIDYLRRGHPKDTYARGKIVRQGSRVANVRVRAWQDTFEAPISFLHGNFMIAQNDRNKR